MTATIEAQPRDQDQSSGQPVVVATDGSAASLRAVDWVAAEARRRTAALRIVAVPALPPLVPHQRVVLGPPAGAADAVWGDFRHFLETAAARAAAQCPELLVSITFMFGEPGPALAEGVQNACMLVTGAPGTAAAGRRMDSVSDYVAGHAFLPVVIVRGTPAAVQGEIVVWAHGSGQSPALAFAAAEAASRGARLRVLYTGSGEPRLAEQQSSYPSLAITRQAVLGAAAQALIRTSAHADLVVAGQCAHLGLGGGGTGTVVHELLRRSHCPVAVIPPYSQAS